MPEILQVLKTESVQKLRRVVVATPEIIEESLDELAEKHSLSFVQSVYTINTDVALFQPQGISQELNKDSENCSRILEALPNLNPANATDERLWVTLSFGVYAAYIRERWQFRNSQEDKLSKHVLNHWFASGVRGRMRNNGISRLWWMGYIAKKVPGMSMQQVYEVLYANSDYRSTLLERNSSANSLNVLTAVLKVSHAAFESGAPYNRQSWRDFMMKVNFIGGRRNLAAMTQDSLIQLLTPVYKKAYKSDARGISTGDER
jgi:hypothetical protein